MPRYNPNAPPRDDRESAAAEPNVPAHTSQSTDDKTSVHEETIMNDQDKSEEKAEGPAAETRIDVSNEGSGLSALIIEAQVIDTLETVFDPEIPVNIYELGLIYGVDVDPSGYVTITMTLTAPSCPAAQSIPAEIEQKIRAIDGVVDVKIDITFDPPWEMSKMSDAARLQLGFM